MFEFTVEVDDSSFREWAERSIENVKLMADVLRDIQVIIWQHTIHRVPVRLGYLESSFYEYAQIRSEYPIFELKIEMTGKDNPTAKGWDYALYMHEGGNKPFNYTVKGELHYLERGFEEAEPYFMRYLETDFLSALGGH